jgi:hypothetical protein
MYVHLQTFEPRWPNSVAAVFPSLWFLMVFGSEKRIYSESTIRQNVGRGLVLPPVLSSSKLGNRDIRRYEAIKLYASFRIAALSNFSPLPHQPKSF